MQNNKLNWVKDSVTNTTLYANDLESQAAYSSASVFNYEYDEIGNLVVDSSEGIRKSVGGIKWNVYGKIIEINKVDIASAANNIDRVKKITYTYDASGNRISKKVEKYISGSAIDYTWYVRDANGNVMSTYNYSIFGTDLSTGSLLQDEVYLYGSSRLGSLKLNRNVELLKQLSDTTYTLGLGLGVAGKSPFTRGIKQYELTNHLGNVLVIISDKKLQHTINGTLVDYYNSDVITSNDYYPSGMDMPGRQFNSTNGYRYGFNGKEKDNKDGVVQYDYGFRIYDPRLARFKSVDPLTQSYPWYTPYQFAGNKPIWCDELDGKEERIRSVFLADGGKQTSEIYNKTEGDITETINQQRTMAMAYGQQKTSGYEWIGGYDNYFSGGHPENNPNWHGPADGTFTIDATRSVTKISYNSASEGLTQRSTPVSKSIIQGAVGFKAYFMKANTSIEGSAEMISTMKNVRDIGLLIVSGGASSSIIFGKGITSIITSKLGASAMDALQQGIVKGDFSKIDWADAVFSGFVKNRVFRSVLKSFIDGAKGGGIKSLGNGLKELGVRLALDKINLPRTMDGSPQKLILDVAKKAVLTDAKKALIQ